MQQSLLSFSSFRLYVGLIETAPPGDSFVRLRIATLRVEQGTLTFGMGPEAGVAVSSPPTRVAERGRDLHVSLQTRSAKRLSRLFEAEHATSTTASTDEPAAVCATAVRSKRSAGKAAVSAVLDAGATSASTCSHTPVSSSRCNGDGPQAGKAVVMPGPACDSEPNRPPRPVHSPRRGLRPAKCTSDPVGSVPAPKADSKRAEKARDASTLRQRKLRRSARAAADVATARIAVTQSLEESANMPKQAEEMPPYKSGDPSSATTDDSYHNIATRAGARRRPTLADVWRAIDAEYFQDHSTLQVEAVRAVAKWLQQPIVFVC